VRLVRRLAQLGPPVSGPAAADFAATPFARLARVQAYASACDAVVTASLAGSLFFSIPTGEARGQVALYLLLTIAPFAIVGPLIGPALDRAKGGRRMLIVGTGVVRVVICLAMARSVDSLLLFPLAFAFLVSGKAYLIARSALIPGVVRTDDELVEANSKLSLVSIILSAVGGVPGIVIQVVVGAEWSLALAAIIAAAQAVAALKLPRTRVAAEPETEVEEAELRSTGVVLASEAMGMLRGIVGFLTFLLAFDLRGGGDDTPVPAGLALGRAVRDSAGFESLGGTVDTGSPSWHFAAALAGAGVGTILGSVVAPRLRRLASEERILRGVLAGTVVAGLLAAVIGGVVGLVVAALAVGTAASAGKQCFDSIVQRDAPDANRGRSFARFETRFQLVWVLGGFLPVVVPIPARIGYVVLAAAAGFALSTYLAGQRGVGRRRRAGRGPFDAPAAETAVVGPRPDSEPELTVGPERRAP
jgi:hypothetical protein